MSEENQERVQQTAEATRDDLIAAAREAGGTESIDHAAEEAAALARTAAPVVEAPPGETEEEPHFAKLLKAREKATAEREAGRSAADEMLTQAKAESKRIIDEARETATREATAERERLRAEFRGSPTATLRALGDPQEISDAVLREGTPEGRAELRREQELAEIRKQAAIGVDVKKQLDELRAEQSAAAEAAHLAQVRTEFLGLATKEACPHLHARYDETEIFAKGNEVARSWRQGGLRLVPNGSPKGERDFDFSDVSKHLDSEAKKRLDAAGLTPAQPASAGAPAKEPGNATKASANGPRTLSAAQGSERRTSPRPITELKPDEARAALMEEVAAARRANPEAAG